MTNPRANAEAGGSIGARGPERFFMCRLISPRPTFAQDMTQEERALMQEHVSYWSEQLRAGRVIVFGPVADPAGAWGLAVVRAPSEAAVAELQRGDPVIRAGRGFRYETLPMMTAVVAG
jgi:hypothetical protein